jgi:DNA-binding NarL/FixJ family response regulator
VRIVIAEDAALFRQGLTLLLQDGGHDIVATAADANSAQLAVATQRPELVILDVRMPPRHDDDGAQLAAELRDDHPQLPIVLLSQHVEIRHIVSLATAGYFGYLLKDRVLDVDDFLDALDRVARGGSALDPEVVAQLVAANRDQGVLAALTEREQAVLALMAEGLTNAGIARRLWLTERTVESHIRNLLNKLGILDESGGHRRVLAVLAFLEARGGDVRAPGAASQP